MRRREGIYVEPLPSGRWRVRTRVGGRLKTVRTFDTEGEAEAHAATYAEMLSEGGARRDVALAEFGDKVLERRELRGRHADPDSDRSRFNCHIEGDPIGAMLVRAIERSHVEEWLERLEDKRLGEQTIRNCRNVLSVICEEAVRKKLLKANPARGIKRAPEKRTEDPWTYADPAEQERILAAAEARGVWELVAFAMGTGLREGEQVALRLGDVHVEGPDPSVFVRYGGPPTAQHPSGPPPKWGRKRSVHLFGVAKLAVERQIAKLAGLPNPHGLLFPRLGGGRWDAGGYRDPGHILPWEQWKGAPERRTKRGKLIARKFGILEEAGITERRFRWHDLRETFASSLVSGWWGRRWEIIEVSYLLGHDDIKTTQRYARLGETAQKAAAREADAMFHAVPRGSGVVALSAAISWSHPRESDPRPTVYETPGDPSNFKVLRPLVEQPWNATAVALLQAASAGDGARVAALAQGLARGVLGAPAVALATRVLAGGEHAMAAAIDLAALVLSDAPSADGRSEAS